MTPKKIAVRALKTFTQTALSLLGFDAVGVMPGIPPLTTVLVALGAAALSALNNAIADLEGSLS